MNENIARVIVEWQENWTPELIERDFDFSLIPEKPRKVITFAGCRRTGKTYLMFQLINKLSKKIHVTIFSTSTSRTRGLRRKSKR